jgi:outer membrane protein OmpA-like peptidoglycan-associated protein
MSERAKVTTKTSEAKKENSASQTREAKFPKSIGSPFDQILFLQRTIGNQAVERLLKSGAIQAKLTIGQPNDIYEQEADRVAEQIMQMPNPGTNGNMAVSGQNKVSHIQRVCPECEEDLQRQPMEEEATVQTKPIGEQITPLVQRQVDQVEEEEEVSVQTKLLSDQSAGNLNIQRKCAGCASGGSQCSECAEEDSIQRKPFVSYSTALVQRQEIEEEEEELVQTKKNSRSTPEVTSDLHTRIQTLRGGGQPLPESVRAYFEPRFGYDFGGVRLHTDEQVSETAKSINARAFTVGRDVAFGAGEYSPGTSEGKKLLAHELAHVVQQTGSVRGQQNVWASVNDSEEVVSGGTAARDLLPPCPQSGDNCAIFRKEIDDFRQTNSTDSINRCGLHTLVSTGEAASNGTPDVQRQHKLETDLGSATGVTCPISTEKLSHPDASLDITFDLGGSVLTAEDITNIAVFVNNWHNATLSVPVRIHGYASKDGPPTINWPLSCRRAEAVSKQMQKVQPAVTLSTGQKFPVGTPGIPAGFIQTFAHGETEEFSKTALLPNRRRQSRCRPSHPCRGRSPKRRAPS